ncbi:ABC transporter ATP-binding protein [Actinoallomurus spadix]|uniref:ABC transporter ATP-binding protein n=1 Tax=Actinoallomurus spadix TaxID=79912 RepID=A0ABN0VWP2_9ACTN|nr:ABC transporter ATP-binding protein [Actinoallomurus spadix]MCO5985904.1 ABC transporter ATP-binding protein [Actinoallomurus spadix]
MTPAAELSGITKRFGSVLANDSVDLTVLRGEIHAVVGENGAGKSTLMSVLYGLYRPDAGTVLRDGRPVRFRSPADAIAAGLGMVHQRVRLFPELTVAENVVLGAEPVTRRGLLDRTSAVRRVTELAERYGLPVDASAPVGGLPVGLRQRVELLKALHRQAEILILDEPTSVLTPAQAARLFAVLRTLAETGTSILLITHKLGEVLETSDRVTVLRDGQVTGRFVTAETSAAELVHAMIGRNLAPAPRRPRERPDAPYALEARGVRLGNTEDPGVTFGVRPGEIVGIAGVAGSGQRPLVDALTGLGPATGTVELLGADVTSAGVATRRRLGLAYVPDDRDGRATAPALSLARNLVMGDQRTPELRGPLGGLRGRAVAARAADLVTRFGIRTASAGVPLSTLSGGNAQKAVLARELARRTPVVIVEEPTQGVDVGAQEQIHALIAEARENGQAVLLLSSELSEVRALADRVLVLFEGRLVAEFAAAEATEAALGAAMTGVAA